jgi:4-diphosphocytidyl-2-C-methyl-D-erythritol kinase
MPEPGRPAAVVAVAPAKINLALRVARRGGDGFHPVHTLFHAVDLSERVEVEQLGAGPDTVAVSGRDAAAVPLDGSNLALRAVAVLRRMAAERAALTGEPPVPGTPAPERPAGFEGAIRISIRKAAPTAGGLAGGSADGAAALVALNELWGLRLVRSRLMELGAELGSDVPFMLLGGNAIGRGRGERLEPVRGGGALHWVLATSTEGLSTRAVFDEYDAPTRKHFVKPKAIPAGLMDGLRRSDPWMVGRHLVNDLQRPALALRPELAVVLREAKRAGACGAVVSGAGPTVACLAPDAAMADVLAERLACVASVREALRADGPVAGAHVMAAA